MLAHRRSRAGASSSCPVLSRSPPPPPVLNMIATPPPNHPQADYRTRYKHKTRPSKAPIFLCLARKQLLMTCLLGKITLLSISLSRPTPKRETTNNWIDFTTAPSVPPRHMPDWNSSGAARGREGLGGEERQQRREGLLLPLGSRSGARRHRTVGSPSPPAPDRECRHRR